MNLTNKYESYLGIAKDGDIVLLRGNNIASLGIQYIDKAYYNHCGIVYWNKDRLEMFDVENGEIIKTLAIKRILIDCERGDFCIIRPIKENSLIKYSIDMINNKWTGIRGYSYMTLFINILLRRLLKKTTQNLTNHKRKTCVSLVKDYMKNIETYSLKIVSPQDFLRNINPEEMKILFNTKIRKNGSKN